MASPRIPATRPARLGCLILSIISTGCASSPEVDLLHILHHHPIQAVAHDMEHVHRTVLNNGMTLVMDQDASAGLVSIQFWVGAGSSHEDKWQGSGIADATRRMVFNGTRKRTKDAIARQIEDAGGKIGSSVDWDKVVLYADMPANQWKVGLDILSDMLTNASFPPSKWEEERQDIIRSIVEQSCDPESALIHRYLWETAYQVHPYRVPVNGYEDIFKSLTLDDIAAFYRQHYVPNNVTVAVAGRVDLAEVQDALIQTFATFPRKSHPAPCIPAEPRQQAQRSMTRMGSDDDSMILCAWHTTALRDPDTPAWDLLTELVGGGDHSRLQRRLVDELHAARSIAATSLSPLNPGLFIVSASVDPTREPQFLSALQAEIESWWQTTPFSDDEIRQARWRIYRSTIDNLRTMHGRAYSCGSSEFYTGDPRFLDTYFRQLQTVRMETLHDLVFEHLTRDNQTTAIVAGVPPTPTTTSTQSTTTQTIGKPFSSERRIRLPNGATIIAHWEPRLPVISLCALFGSGLLSESSTNRGMAQLTATGMIAGTPTRTANSISHDLNALAGSLDPIAKEDAFGLRAECLSINFPELLEIFSDILLHPSFPEGAIARQKACYLAELQIDTASPTLPVFAEFLNTFFPGHPYANCPQETIDSLKRVGREDVLQYYSRHAVSSNAVIFVSGDIGLDEAIAHLTPLAALLPLGPSASLPAPPHPKALPVRREVTIPETKARLILCFQGTPATDPRADALLLVDRVLSNSLSPLNLKPQDSEQRHSDMQFDVSRYQFLHSGIFCISASCDNEELPSAEKLIRSEIARLSTNFMPATELDRARQSAIMESEKRIQDYKTLPEQCATDELWGLDFARNFNSSERFNAITADQVRDVAAFVLSTNRMAIGIMRPATNDKPAVAATEAAPAR